MFRGKKRIGRIEVLASLTTAIDEIKELAAKIESLRKQLDHMTPESEVHKATSRELDLAVAAHYRAITQAVACHANARCAARVRHTTATIESGDVARSP